MTDTRREGRFTMPDRDRRKPPDRRKGDVEILDKKLDERFGGLRDRLERFIRRATIGFAVLGVACAVGLFGFGLVLRAQHNTTTDIQKQRKATIRRNCEEQNKRHDNTITEFNVVAAEIIKKQPELKAQVRAGMRNNLRIIEAVVPHQNCDVVVANSVKEGR